MLVQYGCVDIEVFVILSPTHDAAACEAWARYKVCMCIHVHSCSLWILGTLCIT